MNRQPHTLAPAQEGQWELMCALSPDDPGGAQHISVDSRLLLGRLDSQALRCAFEDVTARHDGLRLTMPFVGWDPVVRVQERQEPPVEFLDLSGLPVHCQRERVEALAFCEAQRRFDLHNGPLWHCWMVRLAAERHLLVTVFCHIIADGWSSKVFVEDLLAFYGTRISANPPPSEEALSFADIHAIQAGRLHASAERTLFWKERIRPLPEGPLIVPRGQPGADAKAHGTLAFRLSAETVSGIQRIAWRARTTPFIALMAAYHLLLSTLAGRDRTVVSTAALNRPTDLERKAILQFACDPYVATEQQDGMSLCAAVRATHVALDDTMRNMMSFKSIAKAVNPDFKTVRPWPDCHLFDGNFFSWAYTRTRQNVAGLQVEEYGIHLPHPLESAPELMWSGLSEAAQWVWATQGGPSFEIGIPRENGLLHYNPDIHPADLMQRLVTQYVKIVDAMAASPEKAVGRVREEGRALLSALSR